MKEKDIAIPGDPIYSTEEMIAGKGLYEDQGFLRVSKMGIVIVHTDEHTAEVKDFVKNNSYIKGGDKMICRVDEIKADILLLEPVFRLTSGSEFIQPLSCTLSIRKASDRSIKELTDIYREGDLLLVDVLKGHPSVNVSTLDPDSGLIMAWCNACGRALNIEINELLCPGCKSSRRSKISERYGRFLTK